MHSIFATPQPEDIPADIANLVRIGTVASVDLAAARCVVRYGDPEDDAPAQTPPIRWLAPRAGLTRIWSPPSVGEQVLLLCPDGQLGAAIALLGIVQDAFPPLGNSKAEAIEWEDGAKITYDPEAHALTAILPDAATALIEAPGGITLRGDVTIEGDLTVQGAAQVDETLTATEDVVADGISLTGHTHGSVQSGAAETDPPT